MSVSLVLMAAGFGSRFAGGIKQIEPVGPNGEVLMDYAVYDALQAGFDRVLFIIRREIEDEFRERIGRRAERKCDVEYVFQSLQDLPAGYTVPNGRTKPWGTGQAVLACRKVLHEPFCVLNADDFYGRSAFRKMYAYLSEQHPEVNGMDCCMAGYLLGNTLSPNGAVTRGICTLDADERLVDIRETRKIALENGRAVCRGTALDMNSPVSMNMWGMPAAFVDYLEEGFPVFLDALGNAERSEYLLPDAVGRMVSEGNGSVKVLPTQEKWFGMTYAEDKRLTQRCIAELISRGVYPEKL